MEFAEYCKWEWLRVIDQSLIDDVILNLEMALIDCHSLPKHSVELLHEELIYWPTQSDIGHQLLLQCTPYGQKSGNAVYCKTTPIKNETQLTSIHNRQKQTPSLLPSDSVRVVSYNILADQHSSSDYSQTLYPYCDPLALQTPYRHNLLIVELLGYHPDIVCLQEVASKCFDFLLQVMKDKGFEGHFAPKTGQVNYKV